MSLTIKAFFQDEIRRIPVDHTSASSFDYIEGKVRNAFPNLPGKGRLQFRWKDVEGDIITFNTDDELVEALGSVENGIFKIYLQKKENKNKGETFTDGSTEGRPFTGGPMAWPHFEFDFSKFTKDTSANHEGVTCDGCNKVPIVGMRYKCDTCPDYDLCKDCKDKQMHDFHSFMEIEKPTPRGFNGPFGFGGFGPAFRRCGKGRRGPFGGGFGFSSGEENQDGSAKKWGFRGPGALTKEQKQTVDNIISTVSEAAKVNAFNVAGAMAGDCAGDAVAIAIRSSIRRALILQKRTGMTLKEMKHGNRKKQSSSSSGSEESDSEPEVEAVKARGPAKKGMKRKMKIAAKTVQKLTYKEVSEHFGKIAAKWAAQGVRQTMMATMKQALKAEGKQNPASSAQEPADEEKAEVFMDMSSTPFTMVSGPCAPEDPVISPTESVRVYPSIVVDDDTNNPPRIALTEEKRINEAIQMFVNMGFSPAEPLINEIKKAKGDVNAVFEKIFNKN